MLLPLLLSELGGFVDPRVEQRLPVGWDSTFKGSLTDLSPSHLFVQPGSAPGLQEQKDHFTPWSGFSFLGALPLRKISPKLTDHLNLQDRGRAKKSSGSTVSGLFEVQLDELSTPAELLAVNQQWSWPR